MDVVVFTRADGQVAVFWPAQGVTITPINAGAVVPAGVPYWIVPAETIPTDRTHRELWEIDADTAGHPDGYGAESNEFHEVANDQN